MTTLQYWLNTYLPGNTVEDLLWCAGLLLIGLPAHRLLARLISRWFSRFLSREISGVSLADVTDLLRPPIDALIMLTVVFVAAEQLTVPQIWHWRPATEFGPLRVLLLTYKTVLMATATWAVVRAVKAVSLILRKRAEATTNKFDDQLVPFLRDLTLFVVVFLGGLLTLGVVFAVNVLALVTSLGIGGLAVALAARETLENLFASFAILLDRPFVAGDAIKSGTIEGEIERIGIRSTRLRTDDGSLLIVPNRLLIGQSVENLSQRQLRRVRLVLALDLNTPGDALQALLTDLRTLLAEHEFTRHEASVARLDTITEKSLDVVVIYFSRIPLFAAFREAKETVNLELIAIVHRHGVRFAATVPGLVLTSPTAQ